MPIYEILYLFIGPILWKLSITYLSPIKDKGQFPDTLSALVYIICPLCHQYYEQLLVHNIILDIVDYESSWMYLFNYV